MKNLIDDPRLTAYALGELPENETKEFEMALKNNKRAQEEVEKIKNQAELLKNEFSKESQPRLSYTQREKLVRLLESKKKTWFMGLTGLVTASLALFMMVNVYEQSQLDLKKSINPKSVAESEALRHDRSQSKETNLKRSKPNIAAQIAVPKKVIKGSKNESFERRKMLKTDLSEADAVVAPSSSHLSAMSYAPRVEEERLLPQNTNAESYKKYKSNEFVSVLKEPLSTFSIDVDTASYSNMRRFINNGQLPPTDSVKVEEFINYFSYDYKGPKDDKPFSVNFEMARSPWHKNYKLVRVALKGKEVLLKNRPSSNLVFLLDVSGSMNGPNKLPLLKEAFKVLLRKLDKRDKVAIVVYAGSSGLVLPSTSAQDKVKIFQALNKLQAGGSTNGGQGIELAYKVAQENFIKNGINRVILATDGDFNVGVSSRESLLKLIQKKAKSNVFLTVLGLGMGNYKDDTLELLSQNGNGNYAYIDNLNEAKKVLSESLMGTLMTIAKDVKIQVEFNPEQVKAYRLVGYENRMLKAEDFNNDKKDAGEIGAGHRVTAFYEVVPKGVEVETQIVDPLKYQINKKKEEVGTKKEKTKLNSSNELLTVKLRFKKPLGEKSEKIEFPLKDQSQPLSEASSDFRFAVAVASFAQILKEDDRVGDMDLKKVKVLAESSKGKDELGYRQEFLELLDLAAEMLK